MTINAVDVANRAAILLNDTESVRWPASELVMWMNDATLAIVINAPDASAVAMETTLAVGTKQKLSDLAELTALRPYVLLDVMRNTAATSSKGVIRQVTRTNLDSQSPNWSVSTPSVDVQHFIYDPRIPDTFYVYPQAAAGAKVEMLVSLLPTDVAVPSGALWSTITGVVGVTDVYLPALVDYVCYRALMKDAVVEATVTRAMAYYKSFADAVGIVEGGSRATAPVPSSITGQE